MPLDDDIHCSQRLCILFFILCAWVGATNELDSVRPNHSVALLFPNRLHGAFSVLSSPAQKAPGQSCLKIRWRHLQQHQDDKDNARIPMSSHSIVGEVTQPIGQLDRAIVGSEEGPVSWMNFQGFDPEPFRQCWKVSSGLTTICCLSGAEGSRNSRADSPARTGARAPSPLGG